MGKAAAPTKIGHITNTHLKTSLKLQILSRYQPTASTTPITSQHLPKQENQRNINKSMGYAFANINEAQICSHLVIKRIQNKTASKSNWPISSGTNRLERDRNRTRREDEGEKTRDEWTKTKGASIARAGTRGYFFDRCIQDQRVPWNLKSFLGTKTRTAT